MSTAVTQYTVDFVPPTGVSLTAVPMQTVDIPTATSKSFSVKRTIDKSSPTLFAMCATGKHFAKVTISLRKSSGGKVSGQQYLTYTMTNCTVSSYSRSAGTETISFGFSQMTTSGVAPTPGALA